MKFYAEWGWWQSCAAYLFQVGKLHGKEMNHIYIQGLMGQKQEKVIFMTS